MPLCVYGDYFFYLNMMYYINTFANNECEISW